MMESLIWPYINMQLLSLQESVSLLVSVAELGDETAVPAVLLEIAQLCGRYGANQNIYILGCKILPVWFTDFRSV